MNKLITILVNIISFLILVFCINNYIDFVLIMETILLSIMFIFYLINIKNIILKEIVYMQIVIAMIQSIILFILISSHVLQFTNILLKPYDLCIILYFVIQVIYILLILFTNIIKLFIKKK